MDFEYFLYSSTNFFKDAEDYTQLRDVMGWGSVMDILMTMFFLDMSLLSLLGVVRIGWILYRWWSYIVLSRRILEWKSIVERHGGPTIVSNDPKYHTFVYADAMQRIHSELFKPDFSRNC